MTKWKVLIVGFGGVRLLAGYTLERNDKVEVTAVVRTNTEVLVQSGFLLNLLTMD